MRPATFKVIDCSLGKYKTEGEKKRSGIAMSGDQVLRCYGGKRFTCQVILIDKLDKSQKYACETRDNFSHQGETSPKVTTNRQTLKRPQQLQPAPCCPCQW